MSTQRSIRHLTGFSLVAFAAFPALATPLTQTVQPTQIAVQFELDATLEAVNQSTISAQTHGAVTALHFDVNDVVEKGALLIEIDNTQQTAGLTQAQASLAQAVAQNEDAQVVLKRNQRLFKQGTLSQGELDSTRARAKSAAAAVTAARAAVKQAREQLAYTRIRAPYSGIVKARHVELGESVAPGTPLMTGLSLTQLRAVSDVPQRLASQYQQPGQIQIRVNGETLEAGNVTLFPYADPAHHSVRLRARLPDNQAGVMPGMWAKVLFTSGERQALLVPDSAVVQRSEMTAVYTQRDGNPVLRQIRTGKRYQDKTEVLSGLSAGDVIYLDGYAQMAQPATAE